MPGNRWIMTGYEGRDATMNIESLGVAIPLSGLYPA